MSLKNNFIQNSDFGMKTKVKLDFRSISNYFYTFLRFQIIIWNWRFSVRKRPLLTEKITLSNLNKTMFSFSNKTFCFKYDDPMLLILKYQKFSRSHKITFQSLILVNFTTVVQCIYFISFVMITKETLLSVIIY